MRFEDYTILNGHVYSQRRHYTERLVREAVRTCAGLVRELRKGEMRLPHGVEGLPPFEVEIGFPPLGLDEETRERFAARGNWFSVYAPGFEDPFQINLVLRAHEDSEYERFAVATILAWSTGTSGATPDTESAELRSERLSAMEAEVERLMESRPMLATTLMPFVEDPVTVGVAADFSTCFAAALLEEG